MRYACLLFVLFISVTPTLLAQRDWSPTLHIGDPAPPLRISEWLKGQPFKTFEKGRVYVLEFWATWCAPCRAAIPHISDLAKQYRDKVTFVGIDFHDNKAVSTGKVKTFVDSMGDRMDYSVAIADSYLMESGWFDAAGQSGIPATFVVNADGRLAWLGYPHHLEGVLTKILNNTWDLKEASTKRKRAWYLDSLDREAQWAWIAHYKKGKPDLVLLTIDSIVKCEPELKYAPGIARQTLISLLQTDMAKAYSYAKALMVEPTYSEPDVDAIIDGIRECSKTVSIPPHIYQLGAEARQKQIDDIVYPEIADMHKLYSRAADWYARANNKSKAIEAQEKAIAALQGKSNFSAADLKVLEARLQQYRNM